MLIAMQFALIFYNYVVKGTIIIFYNSIKHSIVQHVSLSNTLQVQGIVISLQRLTFNHRYKSQCKQSYLYSNSYHITEVSMQTIISLQQLPSHYRWRPQCKQSYLYSNSYLITYEGLNANYHNYILSIPTDIFLLPHYRDIAL